MGKGKSDILNIRIEKGLKDGFDNFCKSIGMTMSGAVKLLVNYTIDQRKIPFQVEVANSVKGVYEGGKLQEKSTSLRIGKEAKEEFTKACDFIGIKKSMLIKMYMLNCINNGKLPF